MILVDTSVWVGHLRSGSVRLQSLLYDEQVLCHPFVIGELACGSLTHRQEILRMLAALPKAQFADHTEVMGLLEAQRLFGRGLGWVDTSLLASALLTRCALWTFDTRLYKAAATLGLAG